MGINVRIENIQQIAGTILHACWNAGVRKCAFIGYHTPITRNVAKPTKLNADVSHRAYTKNPKNAQPDGNGWSFRKLVSEFIGITLRLQSKSVIDKLKMENERYSCLSFGRLNIAQITKRFKIVPTTPNGASSIVLSNETRSEYA